MDKIDPNKEWETPWLMQRLLAPRTKGNIFDDMTGGVSASSPFSFGGGPGRLSNVANRIFGRVFSFDYMGASEYEWGVVPSTLEAIREQADEGNLTFLKVEVEPEGGESADLYAFCRKDWTDQVSETLRILTATSSERMDKDEETRLTKKHGSFYNAVEAGDVVFSRLRDPCYLHESLTGQNRRNIVGGLEVTNGWVVFINPKLASIFSVIYRINMGDCFWLSEEESTKLQTWLEQVVKEYQAS